MKEFRASNKADSNRDGQDEQDKNRNHYGMNASSLFLYPDNLCPSLLISFFASRW
jgi:hypothetical protein